MAKRMSIQWNLLAALLGCGSLCDPKSQQKPVLLRCMAPWEEVKGRQVAPESRWG